MTNAASGVPGAGGPPGPDEFEPVRGGACVARLPPSQAPGVPNAL